MTALARRLPDSARFSLRFLCAAWLAGSAAVLRVFVRRADGRAGECRVSAAAPSRRQRRVRVGTVVADARERIARARRIFRSSRVLGGRLRRCRVTLALGARPRFRPGAPMPAARVAAASSTQARGAVSRATARVPQERDSHIQGDPVGEDEGLLRVPAGEVADQRRSRPPTDPRRDVRREEAATGPFDRRPP